MTIFFIVFVAALTIACLITLLMSGKDFKICDSCKNKRMCKKMYDTSLKQDNFECKYYVPIDDYEPEQPGTESDAPEKQEE